MTHPTTEQRHQHGFWHRQSFDPNRPEGWDRPYPINHRITTDVEVAWSRIHFGLLDNASAAGIEVERRALGRFSGGGCCVWIPGRTPVVIVDSRLMEHRDIVELLAHELGHATHGVMFADDEPDHDRRQRVREVAADVIGAFLVHVLSKDHTRLVLPLRPPTRDALLTVAAAIVDEEGGS